MYIFIGNLPSEDCQAEITTLLKKFNKPAGAHPPLAIHKHQDDFFCVAHISDEKKANKFIKKYHQKNPLGTKLIVREYIHRTYGNERRDINWRKKQWPMAEKRKFERRKPIPVSAPQPLFPAEA